MDSIHINYNTDIVVKQLKILDWTPPSSIGVFTIRDCILIQNFTGKSYTYRAINFINGESQYLFHRKKKIDSDTYRDVARKIVALSIYNKEYPKEPIQIIEYIFTRVFPNYGYTVREEQVNLSKHMFNALADEKISLSDIPVGLGKTHAYLVAAIVHNLYTRKQIRKRAMPAIISTSSIELQKAIISDYIPDISKMLHEYGIITRQISCVLRKGKENYLCSQRLRDYVNTLHPDKKRTNELNALKDLMNCGDEIDLDEVKGISNYDKRKICVNNNNCMTCKKHNSCRYQMFMRKAKKPDHHFQICNHNYFLADVLRRKKGLAPLIPEYKSVIIDEAHKLAVAARQMYGTSIFQNEINALLKKATPRNDNSKIKKRTHQSCNDAILYNNALFKELIRQVPKDIDLEDTEKFTTMMTPKVDVYLNRVIANLEEVARLISSKDKKLVSDIKRNIRDMKAFNDKNIIYWLEKPFIKGQTSLSLIPMNLSSEMGQDLWQTDKSMILTSGTIAVEGDFSYIKKELGMDKVSNNRIVLTNKLSPFNFKENCILHVADQMPFPNYDDDNYIEKISDKLKDLIQASNGHTLVLFTSYKPLRLVYKKLSEQMTGMPFIQMTRGRKNSIQEFKKSKKGVFFATGSMWEGVNIPGDILSHLIIVKLPFPIPDPISEYEKTLFSSLEDYRHSVLVPQMLIKLKQGVGRLIRSETDSGVISILDSRASEKSKYHAAVVNVLPKCEVVKNLNDIEKFLRKKKDKSYFE